MTRDPFWITAAPLLKFKRQIAVALLGALVSAGCFGAGLGMIYPTLQILLKNKQSIQELLDPFAEDPAHGAFINAAASLVTDNVPRDPFWAFVFVMSTIATLTVIGSAGRYLHELTTITMVHQVAAEWRDRIFRRLVIAPLELYHRHGSSDLASRIFVDVNLVTTGHRAILGKALSEVLKGTAALSVAFYLNWQLCAIGMTTAPVIFIALRRFGKKIVKATRRALKRRGDIFGKLREILGAVAVIKVHDAEGYERRRFRRMNRSLFAQEIAARQAKALASPVIETMALLGVMIVACIAAWYIFRRNVQPEEFMTVLFTLGAAGASLKPLSSLFTQIKESSAAAARVVEATQIETEPITLAERRHLPRLPRHRATVEFDSVVYRYPSQERDAVDGVTLQVAHGQTVALVGGNGSGKTTLLSMLPRLIQPQAGRVLIDGVDITGVHLRSLRQQMAVVTQQSVLFAGSIAQNIAYGARQATRQQIIDAARAAFADEFITQLPQGYDAPLGEGGSGLSGGQRQRLCIARAVLRDPAILILDEATSQIDADSEAKIAQALKHLRQGRTTFVIAHRLSTVIDSDLIVVMDAGRIVDQGTHDQLLRRCAIYQMLTQTQLVAADAGE